MTPPTPVRIELSLSLLEFEALRDQLRRPQPIAAYSGFLNEVHLKIEEIEKRLEANRKSYERFHRGQG